MKVIPLVLLLLILSCSNQPSPGDIKKALDARYRLFGKVEDVRILNMIKLDEDTYFAQVKYGIRFKKSLSEFEKELREQLKGADIYRNLALFANIVALNELVRKCGGIRIEKGATCYITESMKLVKIKGSWVVKYR